MKICRPALPISTLPLAFAMALVASPPAEAASRPVELKWTELGTTISGKTVEMVIPGGVTVTGDVDAFRDDQLVLDVRKTSNAQLQPKGSATIPRSSVTVVKLLTDRGTRWRKPIAVIGGIGGVMLGGYIAGSVVSSAGPGLAIFVTTSAASIVAGHAIGERLDKKVKTYRLVE